MKIGIVDDESSSVEMLTSVLKSVEKDEPFEIRAFTNPVEAAAFLTAEPMDLVFLDIEMPVLSGIEIAEKLLDAFKLPPEIIFITAYPQYSLEAWKLEAADYVLKPYDPEQIEKALLRGWYYRIGRKQQAKTRPYIRCFSDFDVLIDGQPVEFTSKRAKELLALLVHHKGSWVGINKISYELLEEAPETSAKNHIRMLLSRLRKNLIKYKIPEILETKYGESRVNPEAFDCDYYDFLDGKDISFDGTYMGDYSWAAEESAWLWRKTHSENLF